MFSDIELNGYSLDCCLSIPDLKLLREIVNEHYIETIINYYPKLISKKYLKH